jgi:hypothetical protein
MVICLELYLTTWVVARYAIEPFSLLIFVDKALDEFTQADALKTIIGEKGSFMGP